MDKRDGKPSGAQREQNGQGDKKLLRKDLLAVRGRLYDKIKIPLKTLDLIIYVLVGLLVLAILFGIGSNR